MGTPVPAPPESAPPIPPPSLEARDGDPPALAAVEGASIESQAHAALASEHGRGKWAFWLVRGSVYVTGEGVEAMARDGRAAIDAAPGLTPGMVRRAASDREQRDGRHFHITLLHRSEISGRKLDSHQATAPAPPASSNDEPPTLLEAAQFASSFGSGSGSTVNANTTKRSTGSRSSGGGDGAVVLPCGTDDTGSSSGILAPPAATDDGGAGWAALSRARGGATTTSQEQEQQSWWWGLWGWGQRAAAALLSSPLLSASSSSSSSSQAAAKAAVAEGAEADALLGSLLVPYHRSALAGWIAEEAGEGLGDPMPLYVYRTSGEGRSLAVALLFLPGEFLRFAHGQVYRPLHITLGFLGTDERNLNARRLGNVQVLAFCQPPDAVRRALLGMCRLLRRMRAHLTQEEVRGFVPRVVELGREVRTVVGMMGVALDKGEEGSLLEELDLGNLSPTGEC